MMFDSNSLDIAAKVTCTNNECGWNVVWHQFGMWVDKKVKCEKCGAEVTILPARTKEMCRLGLSEVKKHVVPESKHYTVDGICKSLSIF